jgi:hypothetical protein
MRNVRATFERTLKRMNHAFEVAVVIAVALKVQPLEPVQAPLARVLVEPHLHAELAAGVDARRIEAVAQRTIGALEAKADDAQRLAVEASLRRHVLLVARMRFQVLPALARQVKIEARDARALEQRGRTGSRERGILGAARRRGKRRFVGASSGVTVIRIRAAPEGGCDHAGADHAASDARVSALHR